MRPVIHTGMDELVPKSENIKEDWASDKVVHDSSDGIGVVPDKDIGDTGLAIPFAGRDSGRHCEKQ